MVAEWDGREEPQTMEPHKCRGWEWRSWAAIGASRPLFEPVKNLLAGASFRPPVGSRLRRVKRHVKGKCVFAIGYPGSGKGTQGKMLAQQLGIAHISTGAVTPSPPLATPPPTPTAPPPTSSCATEGRRAAR